MASSSRKLKAEDVWIKILNNSPGVEHLDIAGVRLVTYEQVLLCYLAQMDKHRAEDATKNAKLVRTVANIVVEKVLVHYHKTNIATKNPQKMAKDIEKIHAGYMSIRKKQTNGRIQAFRAKLQTTMPFCPVNTIVKTEASLWNSLLSQDQCKKIKTDLQFLQSIIADRSASYS